MAIQPQKANASDMLGGFMQALKNIANHFTLSLRPVGNYSGSESPYVDSSNSIVTNPWGTEATLRNNGSFRDLGTRFNLTLGAGQSINLATGQLSDPNLNKNTAKALNDSANFRAANAVGLQQASATSSRGAPSVLAQMDELYLANQKSMDQSVRLTNVNLANENDLQFNSTILGPKAKPTVGKPPAARALS